MRGHSRHALIISLLQKSPHSPDLADAGQHLGMKRNDFLWYVGKAGHTLLLFKRFRSGTAVVFVDSELPRFYGAHVYATQTPMQCSWSIR